MFCDQVPVCISSPVPMTRIWPAGQHATYLLLLFRLLLLLFVNVFMHLRLCCECIPRYVFRSPYMCFFLICRFVCDYVVNVEFHVSLPGIGWSKFGCWYYFQWVSFRFHCDLWYGVAFVVRCCICCLFGPVRFFRSRLKFLSIRPSNRLVSSLLYGVYYVS